MCSRKRVQHCSTTLGTFQTILLCVLIGLKFLKFGSSTSSTISTKFKSAYSFRSCKSQLSEINEETSEKTKSEENKNISFKPSELSHDVIAIDVDDIELTEAESTANIGCGPELLTSYIPMFSYYSSKQQFSENDKK